MKVYPECFPCFFTQVLKASNLLGLAEKDTQTLLADVSRHLSHVDFDATPAGIGRDIYRLIAAHSGVADPYRDIKAQCTRSALALYPELKRKVAAARDPLLMAIKIAAAGNIIDFGTTLEFDLVGDIEAVAAQEFAIDDCRKFRSALKPTGELLYLGDNAGEAVFDRVLIETLDCRVSFAVREQAIINDATRADAAAAGIDEVADIISSGCDAPGTILPLCSKEFRERVSSADLILAKGQGNYEGLSDERLPVFFLLKAKCRAVARNLGVPQGSQVFLQSPHFPAKRP